MQISRNITVNISFGVLLLLDSLMIYLHLRFGVDNWIYNLDAEENIPTYYQGFKLVILSAVSFSLFAVYYLIKNPSEVRKNISYFWVLFSFVFAYLAIDEVGQVHESFLGEILPGLYKNAGEIAAIVNFSGHIWLAVYLPIMIVSVIVFILFIIYSWKYYGSKTIICLSAIIFLSVVPFLEYVGTLNGAGDTSQFYLLVMEEESLEMIGISLLIYFSLLALFCNNELDIKSTK